MMLLTLILRLFGMEEDVIDLIVQNIGLRGQLAQQTINNGINNAQTTADQLYARFRRIQATGFIVWSVFLSILIVWEVFVSRGYPMDPWGWTWWAEAVIFLIFGISLAYIQTQITTIGPMIPGDFLRRRWIRPPADDARQVMDGVMTFVWTSNQVASWIAFVGVYFLLIPSVHNWLTAVTIIAANGWAWSSGGGVRLPKVSRFMLWTLMGGLIPINALVQVISYLSAKGTFNGMTASVNTANTVGVSGEAAGTMLGGTMICGLSILLIIGGVGFIIWAIRKIYSSFKRPAGPPAPTYLPTGIPSDVQFVPHQNVGTLTGGGTQEAANNWLKGWGVATLTFVVLGVAVPFVLFGIAIAGMMALAAFVAVAA